MDQIPVFQTSVTAPFAIAGKISGLHGRRPLLSAMDNNIPLPSTPLSTPPSKKRRIDAHAASLLPSFEEEPHSSPQKLGELGIHVLFSPTNQTPRRDRVVQVAQLLTYAEPDALKVEGETQVKDGKVAEIQVKPVVAESASDDELEYWDRPRESMYVTAFNTAVDTVIEREGHLFSSEELEIINTYRNLPCTSPTKQPNCRREHVPLRPTLLTEKVAMVSRGQTRLLR